MPTVNDGLCACLNKLPWRGDIENGVLLRILARFQLAMVKALLFLIVKNGEDERFQKETYVLGCDHRTGRRGPGVFLGCAS